MSVESSTPTGAGPTDPAGDAGDGAGRTGRTTRNEISGTVVGPVVQAGVVHGDVTVHARPGLPRAADVPAHSAAANLPRRPADRLWGRQASLDTVLGLLDQPASGSQGVALVGMAGVGKTELVLQVIRLRRARHAPVWWISAQDTDAVQAGLTRLAHHLHPDTAAMTPARQAEWALDWLQAHDGWLLVLDNVEARADVAAMLAHLDRGPVLLTSRWHLDWSACGLAVVELDVLTPAESTALLAESAGSTDTAGAERLAAALGHLPLALRQAAAYLREEPMTFDEYARLLADAPHTVLDSPAWSDVHQNNVARTLLLSVDTLAGSHAGAHRLLRTICCFAPDGLPRSVLRSPSDDEAALRGQLALLGAYSLIHRTDDTIGVHRLVWQLVRDSLGPGAAEVATAATLVRAALPADPFNSAQEWPRWLELAPHVEALDALTAPAGDHAGTVDLAAALHEVGTFMMAQGWVDRAARLLDRAATARAEQLGPEDPATLESRHRLAESLRALGQLAQARALQESVLAARLRLLGPADRQTLRTRETLAITYKAMGETDEAIAQHEAILRARVEALGSDDPDVLWSMHNLALTYQQAGRYDEALHLHHRVLDERTRVLGAEHPDTLRCLHNIANTHHAAGRYPEAMSAQRRNLADRVRVLGATHRDTLRSQSNLADTYLAAGLLAEAVELHRKTLARREETLGADNPDTRSSRERLAAAVQRLAESSTGQPPPQGSPG